MAYDSVSIDPDAAGAALRAWQAASGELRRLVERQSAAIQTAEACGPWGGDSSGQQFATVYREGAELSRDAVRAMASQFEDLGQGAGTAIQASLASDEVQAAALAPVLENLAVDPR